MRPICYKTCLLQDFFYNFADLSACLNFYRQMFRQPPNQPNSKNMRHIIFCILLLTSLAGGITGSFTAAAQLAAQTKEAKAPISWRGTARMTGNGQGVIQLTANIEPGWHIYGLETPDDGPRPTEFKYSPAKGLTLSGKTKADKAPVRKLDSMFNAEVEFWEGKVVFTQQFKLDKNATDTKTIKCSVTYMGCNDQNCLPPKTKEFNLKILPQK